MVVWIVAMKMTRVTRYKFVNSNKMYMFARYTFKDLCMIMTHNIQHFHKCKNGALTPSISLGISRD